MVRNIVRTLKRVVVIIGVSITYASLYISFPSPPPHGLSAHESSAHESSAHESSAHESSLHESSQHEPSLHEWTTTLKPGLRSSPSLNESLYKSKPMAVMFTSFTNRLDTPDIYQDTIRNWAAFLPQIQPVLFSTSDSSPEVEFAKKHGWIVIINTPTNKYGFPILKTMYQTVFQKFHVYLYGYANCDILFDHGLNETLQKLKLLISPSSITSILLFGRRTDKLTDELDADQLLWRPARVAELSKDSEYTNLGRTHLFEYFFVNPSFPFGEFWDLVIGRRGLGIYFSSFAHTHHVAVIEGTGTITALQVKRDSNLPSGQTEDVLYNWNIVKRSRTPIKYGYSNMAEFESARHENGLIDFISRGQSSQEIPP